MKQFRRLILSIALSMVSLTGAMAQDIAQIAKSDPLVISGAVGTTNTFYHSTGYQYSSPFQSTIWANLNVSVYGIAMPFSLFYSNSDFSFPKAEGSFFMLLHGERQVMTPSTNISIIWKSILTGGERCWVKQR